MKFCARAALAATGLAALAVAQAAPACAVRADALATRRAALTQLVSQITPQTLAGQAAADLDTMVALGDYYAAHNQAAQAMQEWNSAAQGGDPLGYLALGDHATDMVAKRQAYAAAANLDDATGEREYGEMALRGQGGPKFRLIGREYLIKAAEDGSIEAQVEVGAALVGLPSHEFADEFAAIADKDAGNCYLTAAEQQHSVDAMRALREAYDMGALKDPLPVPSLSDAAAFLQYLQSFPPERQAGVLSQAISKEPASPNRVRALEERVWLSPPAAAGTISPALQVLQSQYTDDATAILFELQRELPSVPRDDNGAPVLHTAQAVQLGEKLAGEGTAGLAALNNPNLSMGLNQYQLQPRLVEARKAFTAAAALAPAVAEGKRWVSPASADDVIADYLDARGGLAALTAVQSAHLTMQVQFNQHGKDKAKTWQREYWAGNANQFPYNPPKDKDDDPDTFSVPAMNSNTNEFIVNNGNGWAMRDDYGPNQINPDDDPGKRDSKIPPDFGVLHAPAVADLDGPLVEYAARQQAHLANPPLGGSPSPQLMDGRQMIVLTLGQAPGSDDQKKKDKSDSNGASQINYTVFLDANTYQLQRISWSWQAGKDAETVDFSDYGLMGGVMMPRLAVYTVQKDVTDSGNQDVERDQLTQVTLNPPNDAAIFSLPKDYAKKIKQALADETKPDNDNN